MGFPNTCVKNPNNSYFTAEVDAYGEENEYTAYLGICFTSKCNTDEMNQYGGRLLLKKESSSIRFSIFLSSIIQLSHSINLPLRQKQRQAQSFGSFFWVSLLWLAWRREFKVCSKGAWNRPDLMRMKGPVNMRFNLPKTTILLCFLSNKKKDFLKGIASLPKWLNTGCLNNRIKLWPLVQYESFPFL